MSIYSFSFSSRSFSCLCLLGASFGIPSAALAQEAPPAEPSFLKTTGSFFTRYEVREGYRALGRSAGRFQEGEGAVYRARLGFATQPIETGGPDVVLQFTPQASGWLGEVSTVSEYDLGLYEGYLRLQGASAQFDIGRFELNYGDALVIGNLGWHQTARAFEGARAHFALQTGWVDVFLTQVAEGRTLSDPFAAGDTYFYGVYSNIGPAVRKSMALDLYALAQTSAGVGSVQDPTQPSSSSAEYEGGTELTVGARAKDALGTFDYRVEADLQFGSRAPTAPAAPSSLTYAMDPATVEAVKVFAYQADAEVGLSPVPGFRLGVGGLVASGDDPSTDTNEAYNQLYPTAHKFLGLSDVFGARSNVASINANLSYKVAPKLLLKAQGHAFWQLEPPAERDGFTGMELNTHAIVPLGAGLKLRGMYGLFSAAEGGAFRAEGQDDSLAHYLEIELSYALQ